MKADRNDKTAGAPRAIDDGLAAAALDQVHDLTVVLDGDGTIVLTNAAWRAVSGGREALDAATGVGANYLDVCERGDAAAVGAGIRAVLAGDLPRFESDYPCHTPHEDAWYTIEVLPLGEPGTGVVVTHTDVSARVAATQSPRQGRDFDPVTLLAMSPTGVTDLPRMLADAQTDGNSLAVVTITLSDLVEIESRHGRRTRDEMVVHVLSRTRRVTSADDVILRTSTNQLVVVAPVADAHSAEFLGGRISDALEPTYLVGADDIDPHVTVTVTASDRFSTLDSLFPGHGTASARALRGDAAVASSDDGSRAIVVDGDASLLPLMVYSLPDGYLQAANEAARSLFALKIGATDHVHASDIADPVDKRQTMAAMSALSSGATDSYRAQRTLMTADGPLGLLTSVRRLAVGRSAVAVVLNVPVPSDEATPMTEDAFSAALVAGTIDANGAVLSVSDPGSAMETELVGSLAGTLEQAVHPDEADRVGTMLASMRHRGDASGALRIAHAEQGWVVCQSELFKIRRPPDAESGTDSPVVGRETYGFVLSANVSNTSMVDRIARLERHIRRIGSEVSAADLDFGVRPTMDRGVTTALDGLEVTARQRDIVERLARGQRVSSIAAELFISRSTVRNHLSQVYQLAGVHSQDELLNALRGQ